MASSQSSAWDRVLVNTSTDRAASAASTTRASCDNPKWPAHAKRSILGGNAVSITVGLEPCTAIKRPGRPGPKSADIASSRLPIVADKPQIRAPGAIWRSRASPNSKSTPRLLPKSSCHSSTTMLPSVAKRDPASSYESCRARLSGVVTSTSTCPAFSFVRSPLPLSPVRRSTRHGIPRSRSGASSCTD